MPSYIVKPECDRDWYVVWSDVVEAPTAAGTREELKRSAWRQSEFTDDRFDRADRTGCSALWPDPNAPIYGYQDTEGFIYEQRGWLRRTNLRAATERLMADENDRITDLLEPFDGEDEVRP